MLQLRLVEYGFSFLNPFLRPNCNDAGLATQAGFIDCSQLAAPIWSVENVIGTHDHAGELEDLRAPRSHRLTDAIKNLFWLASAGTPR